MSFFTTAVSTMSTLVVALGGGVGVWGVVNHIPKPISLLLLYFN